MASRFAELMFTPTIKTEQEHHGSRGSYARMERDDAPAVDRLGPGEAAFIGERDSFYMATVTETGWPYMQHRGGPPGFLKLLDDRTLGFADFRGNRQYISAGNLKTDDRVALFLMDYRNRRRLKLLGHAREVTAETEPELLSKLTDPGYDAPVERGIAIKVEAFSWNCSQHITRRFTATDIAPLIARLQAAEAERDALVAQLSAARAGASWENERAE